jgi:hypothetical protein
MVQRIKSLQSVKSYHEKWCLVIDKYSIATQSNCGKLQKIYATTSYERSVEGTRLKAGHKGKNVYIKWTIRIQAWSFIAK